MSGNYSVISNPTLHVDYGDVHFATFTTVAATSIAAYKDTNDGPVNLTVGATSNVNLEAVNAIRMFSGSGLHQLFKSTYINDVRTDIPMLNISSITNDTITQISATNKQLHFIAGDAAHTISLDGFVISDSNNFTALETDQPNGFVFKDNVAMQNIFSEGDMVIQDNLFVDGHIVGGDLSIYKDMAASNANQLMRVGYGLRINSKNQLEFIKYSRFYNGRPDIYKRVAIFGMQDLSPTASNDVAPQDFSAFADLSDVSFVNGKTGTAVYGTVESPFTGPIITMNVLTYPNALVQLANNSNGLAISLGTLTSAMIGTKGTITIIERSVAGRSFSLVPSVTFSGQSTLYRPTVAGETVINEINYIITSTTQVLASIERR